MIALYKKYFLMIELIIASLIAIVLFILEKKYSFGLVKWSLAERDDFLPVLAGVVASLFGFIITGLSIMIGFLDLDKFKLFKEAGHNHLIMKIYLSSIKFLGGLLILSFASMFISDDLFKYVMFIIIFFLLVSVFRVCRCIWVLEHIIKITSRKK